MAAGFLALVKQKYPDATGNQLIQTLIHNTGTDDHELYYDAKNLIGYGVASASHMLRSDPTQYPDENPLINDDPGASPTRAEFAPAPDPAPSADAAAEPSDSSEQESDTPDPLPIIVAVAVGAVVLIGVIVFIVLMLVRRSRRRGADA